MLQKYVVEEILTVYTRSLYIAIVFSKITTILWKMRKETLIFFKYSKSNNIYLDISLADNKNNTNNDNNEIS